MRVTEKGQVTIPEPIRRQAGFLPGTEVQFVLDETGVHLLRADGKRGPTPRERDVGSVLTRLRGSATIQMSTDEILALTRRE